MEEVFVSKSSAIARIVMARKALLKDPNETTALTSDETAKRLERLERLLFDVRAGRTRDFTMPTSDGEVRVFVTED
ncbi:hypothetical protein H3V53_14650 [Paraburkholderia bengalensis]|uniref:Uncharacterized protein n=1 Tax=Paraburkholderia bengalensis TaxID=2747562 RepID=A0ABU8IRZ2_9BURK